MKGNNGTVSTHSVGYGKGAAVDEKLLSINLMAKPTDIYNRWLPTKSETLVKHTCRMNTPKVLVQQA